MDYSSGHQYNMYYSIHVKTLLQLNFTHKHVLFKKWFWEGDVRLLLIAVWEEYRF